MGHKELKNWHRRAVRQKGSTLVGNEHECRGEVRAVKWR